MNFNETTLQDAYLIELDTVEDERGFFARAWCEEKFASQGIVLPFVQTNISFSKCKGTLRGLHLQKPPHLEAKLLRCISGAVYECIIDLRQSSPTYMKTYGAELSAKNRKMLYVPGGFANGYLTLADGSEVLYQVTETYHPESEFGVRYDDPAFGIVWPITPIVVTDKDREWPDFDELSLAGMA